MEYNNCLLGWEKIALDEKGKRYIKERHFFPASGIHCNNIYTVTEEECITIYDIDKAKQKIALSKIYLEKGETVNIISEHI